MENVVGFGIVESTNGIVTIVYAVPRQTASRVRIGLGALPVNRIEGRRQLAA